MCHRYVLSRVGCLWLVSLSPSSVASTVTVRSAPGGERAGRLVLRGSMATGYVWVDVGSQGSKPAGGTCVQGLCVQGPLVCTTHTWPRAEEGALNRTCCTDMLIAGTDSETSSHAILEDAHRPRRSSIDSLASALSEAGPGSGKRRCWAWGWNEVHLTVSS